MDFLQAAILGIVQGLCEFLPVSSSGHLVLLQNILGIEEGGLLFDTLLHLGTLFALIFVYRKIIWNLIKKPFSKMTLMLAVATVPTVIVAVLFKDFIEEIFTGQFLGVGFLATAIILTLSERISKDKRLSEELTLKDAAVMGCMQAVAIFPGISRSGSTIAGGLFMGVNRNTAANFSFMMSIIAIVGSIVFQFKDIMELGIGDVSLMPIIIGVIFAMISSFFAIKLMLKIISQKKLYGFAIYVGILGALVILDQFALHIFF